jgi:hypothetical protein
LKYFGGGVQGASGGQGVVDQGDAKALKVLRVSDFIGAIDSESVGFFARGLSFGS